MNQNKKYVDKDYLYKQLDNFAGAFTNTLVPNIYEDIQDGFDYVYEQLDMFNTALNNYNYLIQDVYSKMAIETANLYMKVSLLFEFRDIDGVILSNAMSFVHDNIYCSVINIGTDKMLISLPNLSDTISVYGTDLKDAFSVSATIDIFYNNMPDSIEESYAVVNLSCIYPGPANGSPSIGYAEECVKVKRKIVGNRALILQADNLSLSGGVSISGMVTDINISPFIIEFM